MTVLQNSVFPSWLWEQRAAKPQEPLLLPNPLDKLIYKQ